MLGLQPVPASRRAIGKAVHQIGHNRIRNRNQKQDCSIAIRRQKEIHPPPQGKDNREIEVHQGKNSREGKVHQRKDNREGEIEVARK